MVPVDNAAWFIHSLRNFPLIKARSTRVSKGLSSKTAIIKKLHEHYKRLLSLQIYCECESRQGIMCNMVWHQHLRTPGMHERRGDATIAISFRGLRPKRIILKDIVLPIPFTRAPLLQSLRRKHRRNGDPIDRPGDREFKANHCHSLSRSPSFAGPGEARNDDGYLASSPASACRRISRSFPLNPSTVRVRLSTHGETTSDATLKYQFPR